MKTHIQMLCESMSKSPKLSINKYEIDLLERQVVLYLKEHQGARVGKAKFEGVWGHQFSNVLDGNIVVSIEECDPEELHHKYSGTLEEYQQCGLPFNCYDLKEFCSRVAKRSIKPIIIEGQYGFSGWVLCESWCVTLEEA
ncbi:hypothetical protein [uncultured Marinobacter sp.]|uniref:hypothetical protein n=1 Tax=uncultured Marinobacter sp. TaxID=187379 RepID=UPI0026367BFC|nr:hypothetical protein [uncultured Marinobacter sp.]